jgi:hypothetical protein
MAVLAAATMFVISAVVVTGGVIDGVMGERGGVAVRHSRRPPRTSVIPILFSLAVLGALMSDGLGGPPSTPRSSAFDSAPSLSQAALGTAPVYSGPSNDARLPRLNLPITYDYGPGPRHPVSSAGSTSSPVFGADGVPPRPAPAPSADQPPPSSPATPPSCFTISEPAAPGARVTIVTGPCPGGSVPVVP